MQDVNEIMAIHLAELKRTGALLTPYALAIYRLRREKPEQIGSGFVVRFGSKDFLISAAHVLRDFEKKELFIYVGPKTVQMLAGILSESGSAANSNEDALDVGVLLLSDGLGPPYPSIGKVATPISNLKSYSNQRHLKSYGILGFPASKSRVDLVKKQVMENPYLLVNPSVDGDRYRRLGFDERDHLVMELDQKRGTDTQLRHRNYPNPQGMSGAPIWLLSDLETENERRALEIVAIGIEYHRRKKVLVGTDISVAIGMIYAAV